MDSENYSLIANDSQYLSVNISESHLKDRNRDFAFLIELSNLLSISTDLKTILDGVLEIVLDHFKMDYGRIYLLDESGDLLILAAYKGIEPEGLESMSINKGFSGMAARTKCFVAQPVSGMKDRRRAALLSSKGIRMVLGIPLISMDKVGGVMNLGKKSFCNLDQNHIDLLSFVGNQIAVAAYSANLYADLEKKIVSLNEKNEMIKLFTYSISHDLKSPAVGIYGLTKRLQENYGSRLDRKGKDYCECIMNAAEQMVSLIERINTYIYSRESPFCFEKIDMAQIMKSIQNEFKAKLVERRLRWIEPEFYPEIVADRLAMIRIFRNLIDNALKYGGDQMLELKIGYKEDQDFHFFSISDDGVGLQKEEQERIFEQFQRKSTSRGHDGMGLGLAIVREIVERHGGRVWIDNGQAKGTTFCISISKNLMPYPSD